MPVIMPGQLQGTRCPGANCEPVGGVRVIQAGALTALPTAPQISLKSDRLLGAANLRRPVISVAMLVPMFDQAALVRC